MMRTEMVSEHSISRKKLYCKMELTGGTTELMNGRKKLDGKKDLAGGL